MALFQKGVSGNPRGRPKGTGKKQRQKLIKEHEEIMLKRLAYSLKLLDEIQRKREALIDSYIMGADGFEYLN
jgi:Family of unknown function (DUF5681)